MSKFLVVCLAASLLTIAAPVSAFAHCSCDEHCADRCAQGKAKDCSCKECSKSGGCDPKTCSHHKGKHDHHDGSKEKQK